MKRGSALLIVLGMISFMLFSGIAFSVYMRQSRLPSAFLRRTTVTRQLTKAALAEAMEQIEYAIGDDPHPNVRRAADKSDNEMTEEEKNAAASQVGNYWNHRVFVRNRYDASNVNGYTGGDTIATLSLEGLAYLPPCLINEARYYSRHTRTAKWQRFRFDAGRYAYCAIDVSDYFDVNRLLMDFPRASASSRRISLAHIFEKKQGAILHGQDGAGSAADWEDLLTKRGVRKVDDDGKIDYNGYLPLVSLADFNLAIKDATFGSSKLKSPFSAYLDFSGLGFYSDASNAEGDEAAEAYRSMTFVTDSVSRQPDDETVDLEDESNQPFKRSDLDSSTATLKTIFDPLSSKTIDTYPYFRFLSLIGVATLYDYLDEDSVPLSLSIPTVERNPMICAIGQDFTGLPFNITKRQGALKNEAGTDDPIHDLSQGTTRRVSVTVDYILDGTSLGEKLDASGVGGFALYPFLHVETPGSYKLDGKAVLFLTPEGETPPMAGQLGVNDNFRFGCNNQTSPQLSSSAEVRNTGLLSIPLQNSTLSPLQKVTDVDQALIQFSTKPQGASGIGQYFSDSQPWISVTYVLEQTYTPNDNPNATPADDQFWLPQFSAAHQDWDHVARNNDSTKFTCNWPMVDQKGQSYGSKGETGKKTIFNAVVGGGKVNANLALWLRIRNSSNKTVDMVPASIQDDEEQKLIGTASDIEDDQNLKDYYAREGFGWHMMRFNMSVSGGTGIAPGTAGGSGSAAVSYTLEAEPKKIRVQDPRYNHNPNNWEIVDGAGTISKEDWKNNNCFSSNDRDGDIFMSVSDQGYLQSVYELGFLPRLTEPPMSQAAASGTAIGTVGNWTGFVGAEGGPTSPKDIRAMWNTYRVVKNGAGEWDDFSVLEKEGKRLVSGCRGLKVNPYSDSPEVISAAFANTPLDWRLASTNKTANTHANDDVDEFNKNYAWNAYCTGDTKMSWDFILDLADEYQASVANRRTDWEAAFDDLWGGNIGSQYLCGKDVTQYDGMNATRFHSVDKEYLYGFWHDCFAPSQQLFLIFVRAEPMMMGGGVAGNAPPQLSSRAVALVWRDPEAIPGSSIRSDSSSSHPHAMRILFYHPLD